MNPWRLDMRIPMFLRKVTLKGWIIGGASLAVGVIFMSMAFGAHLQILDLMPTMDDDELQRISDLEGQRALYLNLGVGIAFIGVFVLFVMTERSVPSEVAQRQMRSHVTMGAELVKNLNLQGNAVYIPAKYALTKEKVMIPASNKLLSLPIMTDDLVFSLGADRATLGIFLTPPGMVLLDGLEESLEVSNRDAGLEGLEGNMQIAKSGFGLVKDFHIKEREGETVLRIEHSTFLDACRTIRSTTPEVCRQVACPICSSFLTGMARASGKIVSVTDVENSTDRIQFHTKLSEWE